MVPTLDRVDFERPRTQAELRAWVDSVFAAFGASAEGKRAFRLNARPLIKQFKEEVWPLAVFADAFYAGDVESIFQPVVGNQSYDALIRDARSRAVRHHLQISQSFDGEQNYLRMLHLEAHGRAPGTGVRLSAPRGQPIPEVWPEAVSHRKALNESLARILSAVQRKSGFAYEANTSLIVEFEDTSIHSKEDQAVLQQFADSQLLPAASHFCTLYLVSDAQRLAFRFPRGNTATA